MCKEKNQFILDRDDNYIMTKNIVREMTKCSHTIKLVELLLEKGYLWGMDFVSP